MILVDIMEIETTHKLVSQIYKKSEENISRYKKKINRALTLTEKILIGHLKELVEENNLQQGKSYIYLEPDRVALQDVTGQMVVLQFMQSGLKKTSLPTTVHCDHLI